MIPQHTLYRHTQQQKHSSTLALYNQTGPPHTDKSTGGCSCAPRPPGPRRPARAGGGGHETEKKRGEKGAKTRGKKIKNKKGEGRRRRRGGGGGLQSEMRALQNMPRKGLTLTTCSLLSGSAQASAMSSSASICPGIVLRIVMMSSNSAWGGEGVQGEGEMLGEKGEGRATKRIVGKKLEVK